MRQSSTTTKDAANSSAHCVLEWDQVSKRFDDQLALNGVTLNIDPMELVVLVGPSGCGKSTLLRLAAGLATTDTGRVRLRGEVVDDGRQVTPLENRSVGMVFQDQSLFPHLTVHENVVFGLPRQRRRQPSSSAELLELVGLADYRDRYPHELSGGEQQRVALARALAPQPSVLLLDEPFAALDPNLRDKIRSDVIEIVRHANVAAVLVTHDHYEALSIDGRLVVMNNGRVQQSGPPEAIFHAPETEFVARFMGQADFLPVQVTGQTAVSELGSVTTKSMPERPLMMFRPDDLNATAATNGTAHVVSRSFRGATYRLEVQLGSGDIVHTEASHLSALAVGDRVHINLVAGHTPVLVNAS